MLILDIIKLGVYMLHINQKQLDVIQFEKETIILSIKLLQKNYKVYLDIAPLLKFFDSLVEYKYFC